MIIYLNCHPQTLSYSLAMVTLSLLNHLFVSPLPDKLRPLSETALSRYSLSLKGWTDSVQNSARVTVWVSRNEPGPRGWPHDVLSIPRRTSARLQSLHSGHPAGQTQNRHTEPASGESASVKKTPFARFLTFSDASASVNPLWLRCSPFLPPLRRSTWSCSDPFRTARSSAWQSCGPWVRLDSTTSAKDFEVTERLPQAKVKKQPCEVTVEN